MSETADSLSPIIDLAKAREFMLMDQVNGNVPPLGTPQREKTIKVIDELIVEALQRAPEITTIPPQNDSLSQKAWEHVASLQGKKPEAGKERTALGKLEKIFDQRATLYFIEQENGLLGWIDSVKDSIPEKAQLKSALTDAISGVSVFIHRLTARPQVLQWLEEAERQKSGWSQDRERNFDLMKRITLESNALGSGEIGETAIAALSRATSASIEARGKALGKDGTFEDWQGAFRIQLDLIRSKAEALGKALNVSPYEAMLGQADYNPELKSETVNRIFTELHEKLPGLIQNVQREQAKQPVLALPPVDIEIQKRVARNVMEKLGLSQEYARLNHEAGSTFSVGHYDDVRIVARPRENEPLAIITGLMHEMGHAFYNHALPRDKMGQPIGNAQSLWIHETQSTFWERQIACSPEFMEFVRGEFGKEGVDISGPEWSAKNLFRLVTRVKPGVSRIDADGVTYLSHILLRHDLEQKLINRKLEPEGLPRAWEEGLDRLLPGVKPQTLKEGCLQDMHWSAGYFGYFPAYALGMLGSAQLMEKLRQKMDVGSLIREGDFKPIRSWLEENIHQKGSRLDGETLMEKATDAPLSTSAWLDDIRRRYVAEEPFPSRTQRKDIPRT